MEKLVIWWQGVLRMRDFEIRLETCSGEEVDFAGNVAEVGRYSDETGARIRIARGQTALCAEQSIVHELLHVKLDPMRRPMKEALAQLPPQAKEIAGALCHQEEERLVELLATALVQLKHTTPKGG